MRAIDYLDFDLLVERAGELFHARVLHSPSGETGPVSFVAPFEELELENLLLKMRPPRTGVRGINAPEAAAVKQFGRRLFEAVFRGDVRDRLRSSLELAQSREAGLRLRLRLGESPELVNLPWECLYDHSRKRFFSLSEWTPLVRYLELQGQIRPLLIAPPLHVLVMISSPSDYPRLDINSEWKKLRAALDSLRSTGRLKVDRLPAGNLSELQRALRRGQYHVFHYIGHGSFDSASNNGLLVLEGSDGRGQLVDGEDLGGMLADHRTIRLAVLNSCEGARSGAEDPYAGTAQSLVVQGIPAVIAMQFEISDDAAITFSRNFYEALSEGYAVDGATAEAREAVRIAGNPVEWVTPVLYLRAPDGRLFDLTGEASENIRESAPRGLAIPPQRSKSPSATQPLTQHTSMVWRRFYQDACRRRSNS